jgi:MFS family permease
MALALPISAAGKHNDQRLVAGLGAFLTCLGLAFMSTKPSVMVVVALYCLAAIGEITYYPAIVSIVMGRAAKGRSGAFMGTYHATQAVASVGGPIFGGWLYAESGPGALWTLCGGVGATLLLFYTGLAMYPRLARWKAEKNGPS